MKLGEPMALLEELNRIYTISFEEYFGEMDLTEVEKKARTSLAENLEIIFLFYFLLLQEGRQDNYAQMIHDKYIEVANDFLKAKETPSYIEEYASKLADNIVDVTNRRMGDEYYISKDRAMMISANEANVLGNYRQQIEAVKSGKKYKTWMTMRDDKVRHTHMEVNGARVGIFDAFIVGNSQMMYPKDSSLGAEMQEIAGCRCVVKYSK